MSHNSMPCKLMATIVLGAALLHAGLALSHHSARAVFTDEDIVIEGYVTKFLFKNPHISVYLDVVGDDGKVSEWQGTGPATPSLHRQGWTAEILREGQYVRIRGKKGRNNRPMVLLAGPEITAGTAIVELNPEDSSVIRIVGGRSGDRVAEPTVTETTELRLPDGRPNLNGKWFGGLRAMITDQKTLPLNEAGEALQAAFDPINDPTFSECSGDPGLVRQATSILPQRITQNNDHVLFEYEGFAGKRVIYLGEGEPESDEHTHIGHARARYEGDALVIESTQLLANLTGTDGNELSAQTTTIETYRRFDNGGSGPVLELTMIVTDPGHLYEPWTVITRKDYAPDYVFAGRDCQLPLLGPAE
jgi:hypothetical protein